MPNICNNTIRIKGSNESIIKFVNFGLTNMHASVSSVDEIVETVSTFGLNKSNPFYKRFVEVSDGRESVKELCKNYKVLYYSLESYVPMPSSFYYVDTDNNFRTESEKGSDDYNRLLAIYNETIKEQDKECGLHGWCSWRIKNLGNKWNCDLQIVDVIKTKDGLVEVEFTAESAWSGIFTWVNKVQQMFKDLRFSIESIEEGESFYDEYTADGFYDEYHPWDTENEIEFAYCDRSGELEYEDDEEM